MYTVYAPLSKCAFIFHVLDPGHLDCVRLGGGEEGQGGGDWGWLGCLPSCRWRQREGEMKTKISIFNSFCHRRSPWPARLKTRKEKLPTLSPCLFTVSDFFFILISYKVPGHCKFIGVSSIWICMWIMKHGPIPWASVSKLKWPYAMLWICQLFQTDEMQIQQISNTAKSSTLCHQPSKTDFFIFREIKKPLVPYLHENWLCLCCKPNEADDSLFDF